MNTFENGTLNVVHLPEIITGVKIDSLLSIDVTYLREKNFIAGIRTRLYLHLGPLDYLASQPLPTITYK